MYYWANWNVLRLHFEYRQSEKGILNGEVRGVAWTFRSLVEAAALAPDNDFEKAYFDSLSKNNSSFNTSRLLGSLPAFFRLFFLPTIFAAPPSKAKLRSPR